MYGEMTNRVEYGYDSLDEAFPACDPLVEPLGSRILVQIRTPKKSTKSGLLLPDEIRETEFWIVQVAKVLALGPLAFHNRTTGEPWPEGAWCAVGDYVRVPKHGGDRWTVKTETGEEAMVIVFNDLDIIGRVTDALKLKAFI